MRLIALSTLKAFWTLHPDTEQPLLSWHEQVKHADWQSPTEVKADPDYRLTSAKTRSF